MDSEFRACAVCTQTCFKEHGADVTQDVPSHLRRSPCFLLTNLSAYFTPIPRDFVEAHGETLRGTFRVLGANGKEWSVEVGGSDKFLGFKGGWKNFISSTNVKRGDHMLFSLVSKNCFSVYMFNKQGVDVTPSPVVAPKYAAPAIGKHIGQEVKDEPESDDSGSESSDDSEYEDSQSEAESASDSDSETSCDVNGRKSGDGEVCSTVKKGVKRKSTGSMNRIDAKPSYKKKALTSKTKDGTPIEPGSMTTTFESRRRKVTQAQLDRALAAAQSFTTKHPSVTIIMKPSHVYRGFWLNIPKQFARKFLPRQKTEIILQDIHGFEWPKTVWIQNDHHTGLSGGWAGFSKDHCLEEGDVCIYEVIDSRDWRILVHIFRVVDVNLIPGTRGGWGKTYNIIHGAGKSSGNTRSMKNSHDTVKGKSDKRRKKASFSDECHALHDDVPLAKLYKEKQSDGNSDITSEEIDVKPKILSMNPIPKMVKVKVDPDAPATVKVKNEPGVSTRSKVKQESVVYCEDVKPTREQLQASLTFSALPRDSTCERIQSMGSSASVVETEPVGSAALKTEITRTWYPVAQMLGKRQSQKSLDLHELLVTLRGCVISPSESSFVCEDGNGNWWVPRSHFSSDLSTCYLD